MVGKRLPRFASEQPRRCYPNTTAIDAIQGKDWSPRGERARGPPGGELENLLRSDTLHKDFRGPAVPIIEITANDDRTLLRDLLTDPAAQHSDLPVSSPMEQVEMKTEDVKRTRQSRQRDNTMQDASPLEPIR